MTTAGSIVDRIMLDLADRSGVLDNVDDEIREEIRRDLLIIVQEELG